MKLGLTALALAGLAWPGAGQAQAPAAEAGRCTREAVGSAATAMRNARAELMAVPLEEDGTSVPPAAGRRIEAAKDRLRDYVREMMACAPKSVEPAVLAEAMAQRGGLSDVPAEDSASPPPDRHGSAVAFEVFRVDSNPDMLAVVATLAIKCGSDSMLILYRRTASGWWEAMVRRADPYSEVRGGWQDLRFSVSPADSQGRWFVATVSTTPWCSSSWQGLRYALARPADDPARPKVLLDEKTTTWLGSGEEMVVLAGRDSFELRHVAGSLDPEILTRRHVRRYSVSGEAVRRMQPVAESVRDFADEWISSPWAEAKSWSGKDPALAAAHSALRSARHETLRGFDSVRGCSGGATEVQLDDRTGPNWFLLVRGGPEGPWTLERAAHRSAKQCLDADGRPR